MSNGTVTNVKTGPVWVGWNGNIGYTQGGASISTQTFTREIVVQEVVRKIIVLRKEVNITVHLAETASIVTTLMNNSLIQGDDLLTQGHTLTLTSTKTVSPGVVTIPNAFAVGSVQAGFILQGEHIWTVQFRAIYTGASGISVG